MFLTILVHHYYRKYPLHHHHSDIQDFINDKTEMVSVDEILSSTSGDVSTENQ